MSPVEGADAPDYPEARLRAIELLLAAALAHRVDRASDREREFSAIVNEIILRTQQLDLLTTTHDQQADWRGAISECALEIARTAVSCLPISARCDRKRD